TEKEVVRKLHSIVNEADIVIAHNGDEFDIKKARSKFLKFGFNPTALNKTVDTRKVARSQFGFVSNSLNDLADFLDLGRKVQTGGFELWEGCMKGDKASWDLMEKYNKQDVVLLEKIYLKFRSWMPQHPNISILMGHTGCPNCGSSSVQSRGFRAANRTKQHRFRCNDCGAWFIGRANA